MPANSDSSLNSSINIDNRFPDPFCDMASLAMPDTIKKAHKWCEYILMANGPYRSAIDRVVSYFITDVQITSVGSGDESRLGLEERKKYEEFFNDTLNIKTLLKDVALDYLCYGISLTSLIIPFRRYLICSSCNNELPFKRVVNNPDMKFEWKDFKFQAKCLRCNSTGIWKHVDRRSEEINKIKLKRWSPHEIEILHDPHTGDKAYIWNIPEQYKTVIKKGTHFHLERADWEIIEAIKANEAFLFDPGVIYSMEEAALAGVNFNGWGVSKVLSNFRQAWYLQVLQRYNEAIALDYIVPFRVITPEAKASSTDMGDPLLSVHLGDFSSQVNRMLKQHRKDPASWHTLPMPIAYNALGGDASKLAPQELIELGMDTLLNSIGVPAELYRGSLTMQTAPAALRLFEASWSHLVHGLNRLLAKLADKVSQVMGWEPVNCSLQRVTHADDLNRQMAKLQLMMGGQISRTTGLQSVGLDYNEEERRKLEEERTTAEATQDMQQQMEQAAIMDEMALPPAPPGGAGPMGGTGPAGGMGPMPQMQGMVGAMPNGGMPAPPAGGGAPSAAQAFAANQPLLPNVPTTPEEMMAMASTLAQQAITMPEAQKDSFLIKLKQENPAMSALVKSQLEQIRQDAQLRGRELILQQEYGKQANVSRNNGYINLD